MRKVIVMNNLTLDGVMQAPARPDEDTRGGFEHGGWAIPYNDQVMGEMIGKGMSGSSELLLGRRTYEDFYSVWPSRKDNPFSEMLEKMQKYVASTTLTEPLPWQNSTLLKGDAADAVAELKQQPGPDLLVFGSGVLLGSLMKRDLVDVYLLLIHPLVFGTGHRMFPEGTNPATFRLTESVTTTTGVVVVKYELV